MKMETEIVGSQAKESPGLPVATRSYGRSMGQSPSEPLEGTNPASILISRLLALM